MIEVLGVDHLDLTVGDLDRSIPFYGKVLGALGFRRVPHQHYIGFANGHTAVGLRAAASEERAAGLDRRRVGFHPLALRARAREKVDRSRVKLLYALFTKVCRMRAQSGFYGLPWEWKLARWLKLT